MASETSIANRALRRLGSNRITALTDDSPSAIAVSDVFEDVRDGLLRRHKWSFAISRIALAAEVATPAWGYAYYYALPSDCLRVIEVKNTDDFKLERNAAGNDRAITTDAGAPLYVRYVGLVTDPNKMDPLFRETLAAALALELTEDASGSNTKFEKLQAWWRDCLREAKRVNAIEQSPDELDEGPWVRAREQSAGRADLRWGV